MGLFVLGHPEEQYLEIMRHIKDHGSVRGQCRTKEGTKSTFGTYIKYDLNDGRTMPMLHTKKVFLRMIIHELLWFMSGSTNVDYLKENDVTIWDEWHDENGDLGPVYGKQMRAYGSKRIDQLRDTIENIKSRPQSRRHVFTLWNPEDLPDETISPQENVKIGLQALACCHGTFVQFYVDGENLSMMTHQRSADIALGVPFNIMSYAMLLLVVARLTGLKAREITYTFGDTHIYENQWDGVNEQLARDDVFKGMIANTYPMPSMTIKGEQTSIEDFKFEDFELHDYHPMKAIKFPRAAV